MPTVNTTNVMHTLRRENSKNSHKMSSSKSFRSSWSKFNLSIQIKVLINMKIQLEFGLN